jgi:hypothetical protein
MKNTVFPLLAGLTLEGCAPEQIDSGTKSCDNPLSVVVRGTENQISLCMPNGWKGTVQDVGADVSPFLTSAYYANFNVDPLLALQEGESIGNLYSYDTSTYSPLGETKLEEGLQKQHDLDAQTLAVSPVFTTTLNGRYDAWGYVAQNESWETQGYAFPGNTVVNLYADFPELNIQANLTGGVGGEPDEAALSVESNNWPEALQEYWQAVQTLTAE